MDRNICDDIRRIGPEVALLAEGVDRNSLQVNFGWSDKVALLAEGVDRNSPCLRGRGGKQASPSSRRAWIEILPVCVDVEENKLSPSSRRAWIEIRYVLDRSGIRSVALLAEGVDRNKVSFGGNIAVPTSPSSRRAWIEIL